jgi:hypothetical protein
MLIGILQCGHAPDDVQSLHGDFDTMFSALLQGYGFNFKTWNVVDDEFPTSPTEADGWLITGSKHGVYEEHAFIAPLSALITEIYTSARRDSPAYPADLMERAEQATNIPIQDGLIADDIASFFKGTFKPEVLV